MIGSYERTAQKLLKGMCSDIPFCKVVNGRLLVGVRTTHQTPQGRAFNLFWRIKQDRKLRKIVLTSFTLKL